MSATLGALVIAIATEFSVILSARFREERERGLSVGEALRVTYERTGAAVLASGVTAIAGFAVLPIADPIERIFGGRDPDADRVRARHRRRPRGRPARRDDRAAGGAGLDGERRKASPGLDRCAARTPACRHLRPPATPHPVSREEPAPATARRARDAAPRASPLGGGRAPSRYSIAVGIAFIALIVIAIVSATGSDRAGPLGADPTEERQRRCPSSPSPRRWEGRQGTRTSTRTTARARATPCPEDDARTPACEVELEGVRSSLRPLRPPARDLVLVHSLRRLPSGQDELDDLCRRYRDRGELPLGQRRATTARRCGRLVTSTAGRCRSATTPRATSPSSTASGSARRSCSPIPGGILAGAADRQRGHR